MHFALKVGHDARSSCLPRRGLGEGGFSLSNKPDFGPGCVNFAQRSAVFYFQRRY
jgi:hypothetical protein